MSAATPIEISTATIAAMVSSVSTGKPHIFTGSSASGVRRRSTYWDRQIIR